jgi:hypothetical protein
VTLFEYISVAFSIVLSLGAASLLRALRPVFAPDRRYWVHATWVVAILFSHAVAWWSLWSFSVVESWTLVTFLLVLLQPGVLYILASLLVGDAPGSSGSVDGSSPLEPSTSPRSWSRLGKSSKSRCYIRREPSAYPTLPFLSQAFLPKASALTRS